MNKGKRTKGEQFFNFIVCGGLFVIANFIILSLSMGCTHRLVIAPLQGFHVLALEGRDT
jgi:hypothetical protein